MVRWQPDAKERLQAAALELFGAQGFEGTTAAEIARSVGLTERTFFRHFSDKREVLFLGQDEFVRVFVAGVESAPADASPMVVLACALGSAASALPDERRAQARVRQRVIEANPTLLERERHKRACLAGIVAAALRARGVAEPAATLAAESGATVFEIAFAQWIQPEETRSLAELSAATLAELQNIVAPTG